MPYIEFKGKKIEVDDEGYIQHKEDWSRELAEWMAKQDGIELTEGHWKLIDWIREYFDQYGVAPPIRTLAKKVAEVYNLPNVREGNKYIYTFCSLKALQGSLSGMPVFLSQQDASNPLTTASSPPQESLLLLFVLGC